MTDLSAELTGSKREEVVHDLAAFAEQTVSQQTGVSGVAVKGAYSAVQKIRPDIVSRGIDRLLPDVAEALQPHWDDYLEAGGGQADTAGTFGTFLDNRRDQVADSLLRIADTTADRLDNAALVKIYRGVRGRGEKILAANVGGIGRVVEKHAAS